MIQQQPALISSIKHALPNALIYAATNGLFGMARNGRWTRQLHLLALAKKTAVKTLDLSRQQTLSITPLILIEVVGQYPLEMTNMMYWG